MHLNWYLVFTDPFSGNATRYTTLAACGLSAEAKVRAITGAMRAFYCGFMCEPFPNAINLDQERIDRNMSEQRKIRSKAQRSDRAARLHQKQIDLALYLEKCEQREALLVVSENIRDSFF